MRRAPCDNAAVPCPPSSFRVRRGAVGIAAVSVVMLAACGDSGRSAERFCTEVSENRAALVDPELAFEDDIEPLLDLYRDIGDTAPLAVEEDWDDLVAAYETASTVVPGDSDSEQVALAAIYSAEASAAGVDRWLRENCAVDIGPVFTIVPQNPEVVAPAPAGSTPPASVPATGAP
jgi:hypothetical protein